MNKRINKKRCKKMMRELLDRQDYWGNIGYPEYVSFLGDIQGNPKTWGTLDFLAAKGLVTLSLDIGHTMVNIHIENEGTTYFEDICQRHYEFLTKSILVPVIVALLTSALTVGIGYLWTMSGIKTVTAIQTPSPAPIIDEIN